MPLGKGSSFFLQLSRKIGFNFIQSRCFLWHNPAKLVVVGTSEMLGVRERGEKTWLWRLLRTFFFSFPSLVKSNNVRFVFFFPSSCYCAVVCPLSLLLSILSFYNSLSMCVCIRISALSLSSERHAWEGRPSFFSAYACMFALPRLPTTSVFFFYPLISAACVYVRSSVCRDCYCCRQDSSTRRQLSCCLSSAAVGGSFSVWDGKQQQ